MKKMSINNKNYHFIIIAIWAIAASSSSVAYAYDPSPLQDFCVAVPDSTVPVYVNGKFCKDPKDVKADDFFTFGLDVPGNTSNPNGLSFTPVAVSQLPGLNTLGLSIVRIDYARDGIHPTHTNPRSSEILVVLEGTLYVGFLTSSSANNPSRLFTKILKKGDVFVFPIGLIHFQYNIGKTNAVAMSAFNSQNPGINLIPRVVFGSDPPINPRVLERSFRLDKKIINYLQKEFS